MIVTVDTNPTGIGWAIGQDDKEQNRYVVRFGAKALSAGQQNYPQIKRELWGMVTALKCEKKYLIGASVVVETDCLPLLGMITSCSTPNIAMIRWIAYIKSLNIEFKHIARKDNPIPDMLSKARYEDEEEMISDSDDVGTKFYTSAHAKGDYACLSNVLESFSEEMYEDDWILIGRYLSTLARQDNLFDVDFKRIRRKAYGYFLKDGYLWKHPKQKSAMPQRVICDKETQQKLIKEFHESMSWTPKCVGNFYQSERKILVERDV